MWIFLGLLVALGFSLQDILAKHLTRTYDARLVAWGWFAFALPALWCAFIFDPHKTWSAYIAALLLADTLLLSAATVLYVKALKLSDLSLVVPMLSFTPLFMLVTSRLMLGEAPGGSGSAGVVLIVAGSYMLNSRHRHVGFFEPFRRLVSDKGTRYALITALIYSVGANLDKMAVARSSSVVWITYLVTGNVIALGVYLKCQKNFSFAPLRECWRPLGVLGMVYAAAYILQLMVIMMTLAPYLIAVKRMSVVFSSVFGLWIWREAGFRDRLPGIVVMVLGVFLISFG